MRIVIERRVEMADQGVSERRVEIEFDGTSESSNALDALHIVKHIVAALDDASSEGAAVVS
jgi:hypothetical protein